MFFNDSSNVVKHSTDTYLTVQSLFITQADTL